jgi:chromosomal replication initiation ATPase DnaA
LTRPQQLLLDLPHRPALGRDDFLVTESNRAAVSLIDEWPHWPSHAAILVGPKGSGKSHLSNVWQQASQAAALPLAELQTPAVAALMASNALVLEDATPSHFDQTALFHALNQARQQKGYLLITSELEPKAWNVSLPDLASRLGALALVNILPPDDTLLRGVLVKLFVDRQINVDEAVISFILARMPRSLEAAQKLVAEVDRLALTAKAEITRPFVAKIMAEVFVPDLFNQES